MVLCRSYLKSFSLVDICAAQRHGLQLMSIAPILPQVQSTPSVAWCWTLAFLSVTLLHLWAARKFRQRCDAMFLSYFTVHRPLIPCAIYSQCRRVNVGGKLLTNYLKEITSFRQWNMTDEFKLIDQVIN